MAAIAERAHPSEWSHAREIVLSRDRFRCQDTRPPTHALELHVHHLIPRASGGSDDPSNLITLCTDCHAARHPNLQVSLSRRMIERSALRLSRLLDWHGELPDDLGRLPVALRLFRKERFRDGQLEAVLTALRGESMLVIRPTGWGKGLCFQLPAVLGNGTTVVLSPLKALMKDQVAALHQLRLPATFINGDLGPEEKAMRYELIREGAFKLLYLTPERFNGERLYDPTEVDRLSQMRPDFLVVDEAHCVDRWGADFRPDYDRIAEIRRTLGNPPILAFTATAGREAQDRILESLGIPEARRLIAGADRPNIALVRHPLAGGDRPAEMHDRAKFIADLVARVQTGKTMIFVPTVKIGESLKEALAAKGLRLPFYHSKVGTSNHRDTIQQRFKGELNPPLPAVICTNAFGMGLDIPDVRLVVHWQHPASVEDYLQEFGRAGRDGQPALAVLFTEGGSESRLLEWMAEKTAEGARNPELAQRALLRKKKQIAEMSRLATDEGSCFREGLLNYLVGSEWVVPRRSTARRLLEWIFGDRIRVQPAEICCDACDRAGAHAILGVGVAPSHSVPQAAERRRRVQR